jgi:uncharacterized membrane protein YqhA
LDKFLATIEQVFERILWESKAMIVLAVISSVAAALILTIVGTYDIFLVFREMLYAFSNIDAYENFHKDAIAHIISAIDAYLISTVLLIFGFGLYELYISKIDYAEKDTRASKILVIHSLDQLKDKLAKVIVMVLIVTFFKHAISFRYEEVLNLLYLSVGILSIALAVYFLAKAHQEELKE